jgi:integrase
VFHIVRSIAPKKCGSGWVIGFPIIVHPDLGVVKSASVYLHEQAKWGSRRLGTLEDVAYILCSWCNYLQDYGASWDFPTEKLYFDWISHQDVAAGNDGAPETIGAPRQRRRAFVIFHWVHFLVSIGHGGPSLRLFAESICARDADSKARPRFKPPTGPKLKNGSLWIPTPDEVDRVLDALADHPNPFMAERNWLIARTIQNTGLRAMGVCSLSCRFIESLLGSEQLVGRYARIASMALDRPAKAAIRSGLAELRDKGRTGLIGKIKEKRGKVREVLFPFQTISNILDHVWGERATLLRENGRSPAGEDALWLTVQGGKLELEAIKKLIRELGFNECDFKGGAHRLRASFLTELAIELVNEAYEMYGPNYDERNVLEALAERAGHDAPESLRPYINRARVLAARASRRRTDVGR